MMVEVPAFTAAFAADGTATGSIQVASSSGFYVGAEAFLINTAGAGARVIIVAIPDATHVVARIIADDNENQLSVQRYGGGSNLTTWTLAGGAKISMPSQLVRMERSWVAKVGQNV